MFHKTRQRLRKLTQQLPYLPAALQLVWTAAPRYTAVWFILLLSQGLLPVATVYLTRTAVNDLAAAFSSPQSESLRQALITLILLVAVMLGTELLRGLNRWVQAAQSEHVTEHIKQRIHHQAITLDLSYYETPAYYDMLNRARNEASSMPLSLVQNIGRLIQNSITLIAMIAVLLPYGIWIPFALVFGTLPAVAVVVRLNLRMHDWQYKRAQLRRRVNYYDYTLTNSVDAAELRLFALGPIFIERFQTALVQLRRERLGFLRQEVLTELLAAFLGLATVGTTLAILAWQAITTGGSLGDLALFYQAVNQGQKLAGTLLGGVGQIYKNLLFLENLFAFLALEPTLPEPQHSTSTAIPFQRQIELKQVTFIYPGSEHKALDNFSLTIPAGKIVAIVGENGAGKSTLIKLLTRLYDPDEGEVLLDGRPLPDYPLAQLRRLFTVLFQVPVQYQETVYENIAFGDWTAEPDTTAVEQAAAAAGADAPIRKLPDGLESLLGKRFGGSELSVGEWQRVALARAFLRQASVIILDEPTSAMDSWAEAAWLARFRDLAAGKTAVIITHRFTTAMQADTIHVMVGGQVIESGTHTQLIAQRGHYATSWQAQSRNTTD